MIIWIWFFSHWFAFLTDDIALLCSALRFACLLFHLGIIMDIFFLPLFNFKTSQFWLQTNYSELLFHGMALFTCQKTCYMLCLTGEGNATIELNGTQHQFQYENIHMNNNQTRKPYAIQKSCTLYHMYMFIRWMPTFIHK